MHDRSPMANKEREAVLTNNILIFTYLVVTVSSSSSSPEITDTLLQHQQLKDSALSEHHLVSAGGTFRLGFFSPGRSKHRYLGIWYNQLQLQLAEQSKPKPVWVANRNTPIYHKSGVLTIDENGTLKVLHSGDRASPIALSSPQTDAGKLSATLLDSGNFILKTLSLDGATEQVLWQSFDYPTDTLLPGMKLGINFKTGHKWSLTSWISDDVPATGSFSLGGDPSGASQLIMSWQGSIIWTSGLWRNRTKRFDLVPKLSYESDSDHQFSYTANQNERYFTFFVNKTGTMSSYVLTSWGEIMERSSAAPFGSCTSNIDLLSFSVSPSTYLPAGCMGQPVPKCRERYATLSKRSPSFHTSKFQVHEYYNLSFYDCRAKCFNICSCVGFASDNLTAICEIWSEGLSSKSLVLSHHEQPPTRQLYFVNDASKGWHFSFQLIVPVVLVSVLLLILLFLIILKKVIRPKETEAEVEILLHELGANGRSKEEQGKKSHELHFFSLESIAYATNNFSDTSKLGEGGFGSVYKGVLPSGKQIAVKRLSSNSRQGLEEFRNEALMIARLQHTNLVSIEGCCLEKGEKMLIYEYMPNKSLDFFLFDPQRKHVLDWKKRYNIIEGVGQGLLYLHKHSRLRVIHRDLKASNILLDADMNPKISDFGMATIFEHHQSQARTERIVGTYGYMSPEYAMHGIFSTKSDIFSFGVLMLEIISGRKNNSFNNSLDGPTNLVGYAWKLWMEFRGLELIDSSMDNSYPIDEVIRCMNVGLLCVQENPVDRPAIVDVLSMIYREVNQLATPKQPAYYYGMSNGEAGIAECGLQNLSLNKVSISEMEAR